MAQPDRSIRGERGGGSSTGRVLSHLPVGPLLLVLAVAAASLAIDLALGGHDFPQATVVLSKAQLASLGLTDGPDSPAVRWNGVGGRLYLLFTATPGKGLPAHLYLVPLTSAGGTTSLRPLAGPRAVLSPSAYGEPNPVRWCSSLHCFDSNYSGGGTLLKCPAGGPLLLSYHGESRTDPSGRQHSFQGWTGIGLARWDPETQRFVKIDQIIGLHASNAWHRTLGGWRNYQLPTLSFEGDLVLDPQTHLVYLYYGDDAGGDNPAVAVAAIRLDTLCADAARGIHSRWSKWFQGSFSQPAVYTSPQNGGRLPAGTGGRFTPLLNGDAETAPNVLYEAGKWYMVTSTGHLKLSLRTSLDGITWSAPTVVYAPPSGKVMYPYLWAPRGTRSGRPHGFLYVTFTWMQSGPPWKHDFALEQIKIAP